MHFIYNHLGFSTSMLIAINGEKMAFLKFIIEWLLPLTW
jgi:hypothetical protein